MASSPLYMQIAQNLASEIATGIYPVGSNLPTEADLCQTHEVSRSTAREALRCLVERGLIRRRVRVGSQVISATPIGNYQPVAANTADIVAFFAETRVIGGSDCRVTADTALVQQLACKPGTELFLYQGPRYLRDGSTTPLSWSEEYIPSAMGEVARKYMLSGELSDAAVPKNGAEQIVMAAVLDARLAEQLQAEAGTPALVVIRRHFKPNGDFIGASVQTHPADRYQLRIPIAPSASNDDTEINNV